MEDKGSVMMKTIGKLSFNKNDKVSTRSGCLIFRGKYEDEIDVAIKRVLKDDVKLEITILKRNHIHPNIINYYGTEKDDDFYYIGMELCLCSLESYVKKQNEIPIPYISMPDILMQATCGLKYLHGKKVVHREIKPENILISVPHDGALPQIRLSDFGMSRVPKDGKIDYSMSGSQHGTQGWIAPELLKDGTHRYTDRVDIFPLGCVFCYSLTGGEHPYGEPLYRHSNIVQGVYQLPSEKLRQFNHAAELIEAMLDQDPSTRLSAEQVYEHAFFDVHCRQPSLSGIISTSTPTTSSPSSAASVPNRSQQISELFDMAATDLGRGSFNTVVRIISMDGQKKACKRIEKKCNNTYMNEVQMLKNEAFNHSTINVARYFEWPEDSAYCYIIMELCDSTLEKCISSAEHKEDIRKYSNSMLNQIALGVQFLHGRARIVHCNIKPSNILVVFPSCSTGNQYLLKLADFGISKWLDVDETGVPVERRGSDGWRAPEICGSFADSECTGAADVFAAGCVFFVTSTLGKHPFTENRATLVDDNCDYHACQSNIDRKKNPDLQPLETQRTLHNLVEWMVKHSPEERPTFRQVLSHPFFWSAKETLAFISKISAKLEYNGKPNPEQMQIIQKLEEHKNEIFVDEWKTKLSSIILENLETTRKYNGKSVHNLLRAIRNKCNHYEMSTTEEERSEYGSFPDGYWKYWSDKFPNFIIYAWYADGGPNTYSTD